jgi:hypothetical protein
MITGVAASTKSQGITCESLEFPEPAEFLDGSGGQRFALVPMQAVIAGAGKRAKVIDYFLGVREAGADHWTYIQGTWIGPASLPSLVPEFPVDHPLPPRQTTQL